MNAVTAEATLAPVCHLSGASKSYRIGAHRATALSSVSLEVSPGEVVALTGPSGSGKSTLLNVCGLIDAMDSGAYAFQGREIGELSERQRTLLRRDSIGFIFQSFNLVPVMTVAENVDYPLFLSGVAKADRKQRVASMLERVGLSEFAMRRPDVLSGGQRQRVAVARALIKKPQLVIADEPTANLDSKTAEQVFSLMRDLCRTDSAACLIATHDDRITKHCDRVLRMRDGELQ